MRGSYRTVAMTGLVALCATGMTVGAGSAFADSAVPAEIAVRNCDAPVQANPGDHLVVSAKTLLAPQMKDLGAIPVVGPLLVGALDPALSSLALPPFTVTNTLALITKDQIADAFVAAVPALPPVAVAPLRAAVANACADGVVVQKKVASVPTPAPTDAPTPAPTPPADSSPVLSPSAPADAPVLSSYGSVPRYTYNDLTSVPAGGAGFSVGVAPVLPPASLTGYGLSAASSVAASRPAPVRTPQLGLLQAPATSNAPTTSAPTSSAPATESPTVRPASGMSEVTALPVSSDSRSQVPAEAVLAALLLALTTAALLRTWVLRRSTT